MKVVIESVSKNRDKWLALKEKTVGMSEIGVICGVSQWATPLELWGQKTGRLARDAENDAMWLGTKLQPVVGELFCKKTGIAIAEPDCMYAHATHEWATATPDYFAFPDISSGQQRVLEIKTTSARAAASWDEGNAPTLAYMQTVWQLGVLGLDKGYIAALIGGQDFRSVDVEFQSPLFEQMLHMASQFMKCIETDTPPAAKADDVKILDELRRLEDRTIQLPPETIADVLEFNKVQEQIKVLKNELKVLDKTAAKHRVAIEQLMGNASRGLLGKYQIVLNKVERDGYTVQPSSYTTFKVKELEHETDGAGLGA